MIESSLKDGIWVHEVSGSASLLDLFHAAFGWFRHPQFDPNIPILWDARTAFLQISYEELITSYLSNIEQVNLDRPVGKSAWLVSNSVTKFILDEIIQQVQWAAEWRAFQDTEPAAAIRWLTSSEP